MFLESWKVVKSKKIPKKACAQGDVTAMFVALRRHEDDKKIFDCYSWKSQAKNYRIVVHKAIIYIWRFDINANCKMIEAWKLLDNLF